MQGSNILFYVCLSLDIAPSSVGVVVIYELKSCSRDFASTCHIKIDIFASGDEFFQRLNIVPFRSCVRLNVLQGPTGQH